MVALWTAPQSNRASGLVSV